MKKLLKSQLKVITSFVTTIISVLSVIIFSKHRTNKYFKSVLKGSDDDRVIYILGNGNSLSSFLDEKQASMPQHVMVVNYFATTPHFSQLRPKHYIMLDNNLCIKADEGNALHHQQLIKALLAVDWKMNIYIPADSDPALIKAFNAVSNINLVLYNRTPVEGLPFITHWFFNHRLGMPRPQNVSNSAVFCSIAAGFKTLYLYGIEHSWTKSFDVDLETHRVFLNDGHFYETDNKRFMPINDYSKWLLWIHFALESHLRLREYADSLGIKIINKTKQSFVEAYEYE